VDIINAFVDIILTLLISINVWEPRMNALGISKNDGLKKDISSILSLIHSGKKHKTIDRLPLSDSLFFKLHTSPFKL
jgi:hypothetical protein